MCLRSLEMHRKLAADGFDTGFRHEGLLDVYETEAGLERGRAAAALHVARGLSVQVPDAGDLRNVEPSIAAAAAGGVLFRDEAHADPLTYIPRSPRRPRPGAPGCRRAQRSSESRRQRLV